MSTKKLVLFVMTLLLVFGGLFTYAGPSRVLTTLMMWQAPTDPPTLTSDFKKYSPGDTMNLTGANFWAGEGVRLDIYQGQLSDPNVLLMNTGAVNASLDGGFTYSFVFPWDSKPGTYNIVATGLNSGLTVTLKVIDPPGHAPSTDMNFLQMDGNIIADINAPSVAGDPLVYPAVADWGNPLAGTVSYVFQGTAAPTGAINKSPLPPGFTAAKWINDQYGSGYSGFAGGSTSPDTSFFGQGKDISDIGGGGWTCVSKSNPSDKDDLMHAYASLYVPSSGPRAGRPILYMGAEVASPNGTHAFGFWFLQNPSVACDPAVNNGQFSGGHQEGDILLEGDLDGGGHVSTITVYKWTGGALALQSQDSGASAECGSSSTTHNACGSVNAVDIPTPWPTHPSAGADNRVPANAFLESVIDLSVYTNFNPAAQCFSQVVATSRTSTGTTSDIKDFAAIPLDTCATLKIQKNLIGATDGSFTFNITGPSSYAQGRTLTITGATSGVVTIPGLQSGLYTVTEQLTSGTGWELSSIVPVDGTATVLPGAPGLVTFTNTAKGKLTITKTTQGGDGAFSFTVAGPTPSTQNLTTVGGTKSVTLDVIAGAYTVTEGALPPGWNAVGSTSANATVAVNGTASVSFTNAKEAKLTVNKVLSPNVGTFNLLIDGVIKVTNQGNGGSTGAVVLAPGSHAVTEEGFGTTNLSNYDQSFSASCPNGIVSLSAGDDKTCTITNTLKTGTLIVKKHVVNDNGGTATASQFTLHVKSGASDVSASPAAGSESGTSYSLNQGSYTVSEDSPLAGYASTGFSGDCDLSGIVQVQANQTKTCTITNDDVAPTLVVKKHVINNNGGTVDASGFTLTVTNSANPAAFAGNEDGTTVTVKAGAMSVSEAAVAGYSQTGNDCPSTIALGATVTCTVTNDDIAPTLVVKKHVINNNGGTVDASGFTLTVTNSANPAAFAGNEDGTTVTVKAGAMSVSEAAVAGYSQTGNDCPSTIALAATVTCTVTNDDIAPTLVVKKHVINNNGGTVDASGFTLTVTNSANPAAFAGNEDGTTVTVKAGAMSVSEAAVAGYSQTGNDCPATIALAATVTCTVTNDDIAPTLVVKKHVINNNGGTVDASGFTLTVTNSANPAAFAGNEDGTTVTVKAGAMSVSEAAVAGYSQTGNDCPATIALGQSVTCTVTNDDIAPTLVVKKHVINNNGGTVEASGFTLTVTNSANPAAFAGNEDGTTVTVKAGAMSVSEAAVAGYSQTGNDCPATIALAATVTCTVTNDDVAPTLVVKKHVINDNGGTVGAAGFTLSVANSNNPPAFPGSEAGTNVAVKAGSIVVSEAAVTGYTQISNDCPTSIALGATVTCTITNNDDAPTLIVKKHVINDNGGTVGAAGFTLSVANSNNPPSFPGDEAGTNVAVKAGSIVVSEVAATGYTQISNDCPTSIALGQTVTCTITNNDNAPTLIVKKHVINDNGGALGAAAFTLSVGNSNNPPAFAGDEAGTNVAVKAGSILVSEGTVAGYTQTGNDCPASIALGATVTCTITNNDDAPTLIVKKHVINDNGGTLGAAAFTLSVANSNNPPSFAGSEAGTSVAVKAGSILVSEVAATGYTQISNDCPTSIALGQTVTCTITNNDNAPTLIVKKHVINDNGGTLGAAAFTLGVANSNNPPAFAGDEAGTNVAVKAGSILVSEGTVAGYTQTGNDCPTSIALGATVTCTITNNDDAPTLIVKKHVINNNTGTLGASAFTITVTNELNPAPFAGSESGTNVTVKAGAISVSEGDVNGYSQVSNDCPTSIALGQTVTCTITNDDWGTWDVKKIVINDNGGTKVATEFQFLLNGVTPAGFGATDDPLVGFTQIPVPPTATVFVTEGDYAGYTKTIGAGCAAQSVALNAHADCVITNDDNAPTLIVKKHVISDNGGTAVAGDFTLTVNNSANPAAFAGSEDGTNVVVKAGSISVSESGAAGYTQTGNDCPASIALGQTVTCTITNDDSAPTLIVKKHVINDNTGTLSASAFTITVANSASPAPFAGSEAGTNVTVKAGSISVTEGLVNGYSQTSNDCPTSIALGQSVTCTVTNNDWGTWDVRKVVINNSGGTANSSAFSFIVHDVTAGATIPVQFPANGGTIKIPVDPGHLVYVTEATPLPAGYAQSSITGCGTEQLPITVSVGEHADCVVTNDDITAHLTLVKHVTNNNGGTEVESAWTLSATGTTGNATPSTSGAAGFNSDINAGSYNLGENGPSGYLPSAWTCSGVTPNGNSITLALGQIAQCDITNDDQPGHLTIVKKTDPQGSTEVFNFVGTGVGSSGPFTLTGANGSNTKTLTIDQQPPLTIREILDPNTSEWRLTKISCTGGKKGVDVNLATGTVTINIIVGDDMKCTFWNELPRMTGGGFVDTSSVGRVSHGFELYCGVAAKKRSSNLEVNWGGNAFHMDTLLAGMICDGNPTSSDPLLAGLNPEMPNAPFNAYTGHGTGGINKGKPNTYYAQWKLVDNGEPGSNDTFALTIWNVSDLVSIPTSPLTAPTLKPGKTAVISFGSIKLGGGNHQAH